METVISNYKRALAAEPRIEAGELAARSLAVSNPNECHYDSILKPIASLLVGRDRGMHDHAHNPEDRPKYGLIPLSEVSDPITTGSEPATEEERWLRTEEAYDAVTDVWLDLAAGIEVPGL